MKINSSVNINNGSFNLAGTKLNESINYLDRINSSLESFKKECDYVIKTESSDLNQELSQNSDGIDIKHLSNIFDLIKVGDTINAKIEFTDSSMESLKNNNPMEVMYKYVTESGEKRIDLISKYLYKKSYFSEDTDIFNYYGINNYLVIYNEESLVDNKISLQIDNYTPINRLLIKKNKKLLSYGTNGDSNKELDCGKLWLPTTTEVFNKNSCEGLNILRFKLDYFNNLNNRIKKDIKTKIEKPWMLQNYLDFTPNFGQYTLNLCDEYGLPSKQIVSSSIDDFYFPICFTIELPY